jgi:ribosome-associated protein YbcJ (S4-like RNA binding protein)
MEVTIRDDFIKLGQALKLAGAVGSGVDAKFVINDGLVKVNGKICTERGRKLRETICEKLKFDSLDFQSLDGIVEAIGLPKCELCTYCWDGEE